MQLIQMIMAMLQGQMGAGAAAGGGGGAEGVGEAGGAGGAGGAGNAGNAGNAGGAAAVGGGGGAGAMAAMDAGAAAAQAAGGLGGAQQLGAAFEGMLRGDVPNVAVIDDFSRPGSHGDEIANIIANGDPAGQGINTLRLNIANGGDLNSNIAGALDQVLRQVQNGGHIDAVNLSQQNFNGGSQAIEDRIRALQQAGVPVVVAAGNGGPGQQNGLARGAALVVENSARGSEGRSNTSGVGNVRAEGQFTSQATATVTAQAARAHANGATNVQQVQQQVQQKAQAEGGSLNAK